MDAARRGDDGAFMDLIRPRAARLFAIAHRILRDSGAAEDALQEALVTAWQDLPGLREADRFDAWLRRLIVRSCVLAATRERRRVAYLRELPIDGPAAHDETLTVALRDQLERGFRRLPPDQRAILVLFHFAGYAPAEIAEVLGIPASTARSRLQHAHHAMRAALDADARKTAIGGRQP